MTGSLTIGSVIGRSFGFAFEHVGRLFSISLPMIVVLMIIATLRVLNTPMVSQEELFEPQNQELLISYLTVVYGWGFVAMVPTVILWTGLFRAWWMPERTAPILWEGPTQFKLLGAYLATTLLWSLAFGAGALILGTVAGLLGALAGQVLAGLVAVAGGVALFAFALWSFGRIWMVAPHVVRTEQMDLAGAWAMTRDHAWLLVGIFVVGMLAAILAGMTLSIVVVSVLQGLGLDGLVNAALVGMGQFPLESGTAISLPQAIIGAFLATLYQFVIAALFACLTAGTYDALTDELSRAGGADPANAPRV